MNKDIFNASPTSPVAVQSDALKPRMSNYYYNPLDGKVYNDDGTLATADNNGAAAGNGLGKDDKGSGLLSFFGGLANTLGSVATSIWGTSDNVRADMWRQMAEQEKKTTNLMIGIVVALVLLAFVFLIIKKK